MVPMTARFLRVGRRPPRRLSALPVLVLLLLAGPAAGLDTVWLVRHAEKAEPWPADRDLDALRPLSAEGTARAAALADRLKEAGIAGVYTSRTTRTIATGLPLATHLQVPLVADDATTRPGELSPFLARLRERHAGDRAVLIVGHSNTIPQILAHFGVTADCFGRLGIKESSSGPEAEGYEGLWKVDLAKKGCAAVARN